VQISVERGLRRPDVQHSGDERREEHETFGVDENGFSAGECERTNSSRRTWGLTNAVFFSVRQSQTGGLKVNLGENKRIKINGQRVSVPYKRSNELTISNMNDTVLVETRIGVSVVWDGRGFLEVSVPSRYKGEAETAVRATGVRAAAMMIARDFVLQAVCAVCAATSTRCSETT